MIHFAPYLDEKYALFASKIVNTSYPLLGVRMPILHKIAKELSEKEKKELLAQIPKNLSCEEWLVMGDILASELKRMEIKEWWSYTRAYLLRIDSWNYVDNLFAQLRWIKGKKYGGIYNALYELLLEELYCKETFVSRFVIMSLTRYYPQSYGELLGRFCDFENGLEYYLKMGVAWAISEIYCKERERIFGFLKESKLSDEIHSLSIRKICESKQVSNEERAKIKALRRAK